MTQWKAVETFTIIIKLDKLIYKAISEQKKKKKKNKTSKKILIK